LSAGGRFRFSLGNSLAMTDSTFSTGDAPVVIKKRGEHLIDTKLNTFATLNTLSLYLKQGEKFIVIDERSGKDLTQEVLMRINLQKVMADYMRTLV
jgi:polyhydroxyalkanoate synthesis regulator protein